ncbi:MAG: hypothetical protein KF802_02190 [Bdellovibrionaceae bacterium]|nr:hypothetical protein [Pseudobdellovibrionaceae bacterium]MBX3033872.1 hypothetical protein [Pseudobdellovibrionaceae bacterium]
MKSILALMLLMTVTVQTQAAGGFSGRGQGVQMGELRPQSDVSLLLGRWTGVAQVGAKSTRLEMTVEQELHQTGLRSAQGVPLLSLDPKVTVTGQDLGQRLFQGVYDEASRTLKLVTAEGETLRMTLVHDEDRASFEGRFEAGAQSAVVKFQRSL